MHGVAGLDLALPSTSVNYHELMREQFRPPKCLIRKVKAGGVGRKTGEASIGHESEC